MPISRTSRVSLRRGVALLLGAAVAGAGLVAVPVAQPAQAAQACTSVPFKRSTKARKWYRVPAVVSTGAGRVLAFAERRDRAKGDNGNFDIVMRVSKDSGCHWGALKVVSNNGRKRVSNPVPVYEPSTGRVLLFTTVVVYNPVAKKDVTRLHVQAMNADGTHVTALAAGQVSAEGWVPGRAMGNSGPGHAIVLAKGAHPGRIIVPLSRRESSGAYFLYSVYSDDHGATWHLGYYQNAGGRALIEGSAAEAPDGTVLVTYREKNSATDFAQPGRNRVLLRSSDAGETISASTPMPGVRTVPVFGSLLTATGTGVVLLSSPDRINEANLFSRRGMRIFVSTDSGASWHASLGVGARTGSAGYSDLVQLNDTTVGIVYERGYTKGWEQITFTQVALADLT